MSNTASLRRTDPAVFASAKLLRHAATVAATLLLTVLLVTFRPFQPQGAGPLQGGDIVNQLGFGAVGAVATLSLIAFVDPRRASALLSPWWLIMLFFLFLSVLNAIDPNSAARAAAFTMIGIVAVAAIVVLPQDGDGYSTVFLVTGMVVVSLSYLGVALLPGVAIHGSGGFEPEHAGFWRGSFSHKNVAGPVMACLSFAGLYAFRRGRRWSGGFLFLAALWFLANTGSKTTAGLVPVAVILIMGPRIFGVGFLTPTFFLAALIGTGLGTLGVVLIEPIKQFAAANFDNLTYTGRTTLWSFSAEMIAKRPWTGYGFESFWGSPLMLTVDKAFDADWDVTGIVHGHNGYLDLAVIMGLPALVFGVIAFILAPLRDYQRTLPLKENYYLADFFLMVLLFTTLNAFLESFFFRRADPVWLFMVMAILGLRLTARFPIPSSANSR